MHTSWLSALVIAAACCDATPLSPPTAATKYLFITGDSFTTIGFNVTVLPRPSLRNPLGISTYSGATLSGGENWVDVVLHNSSRTHLGPLNGIASGTIGYDFAVGSSTVNFSETALFPADRPHPVADMSDQVDEIEILLQDTSLVPPLRWTDKNSMFINWFGINDIFYNGLFTNRTLVDAMPHLHADVGDYFEQCDRLYRLGARQFLTMLVPPIHRIPVVMGVDKASQAQNMTQYWNGQIRQQNVGFLKRHADATSHIFDPAPVFNDILDNFEKYGAPDNICFSYPQGEPCLWHDFIHPGLLIQKSLGEAVSSSIEQTGFFQT